MFNSSQIAQMIGGQQVMFANQAAFARNVGVMSGTNPGGLTPLSSPSFGVQGYGGQEFGVPGLHNNSYGGIGAAAVGGMGSAIPGIASGLSMAGGLGFLGSAGGYLDPLTGVGRAFMGGMAGAGGLSGGLGAIGAGVGAAALPAAGYYAAYKGISHVGQNLYEGAQNISQVGAMAQNYFGNAYGSQGARPGGQFARGQIQEITGILHEIAGQDTVTSMRDMKSLMDKAGQFGMLTGIQSASEFKDKFKRVVDQAKQVAQIMGSTLDEGMGAISQFRQMGMWSAQDVMGGAVAMKMVGPQGSRALMQTMQAGAQMSHAMGGSLASGAALGRNQFLNIQAAQQSGILAPETIQELTGGVGGVEGQQMLAERLTGMMQSMTQTPVGRLSMAGLGEVKGGKFTGRVNKDLLRKMQNGELSVGELQSMGMKNASTREGAASFTYRQEQLGQEMMAQGGLELVGGMFQAGLERAGFGGASEDIQGLMLQKMYGLQRQDAQMMQKLIKDLPRMQDTRSRKEIAVLQDSMRQLDERRNRSWQGLKDVVSHAFEETMERPLQELGESMSTSINESVDKVTDYIMGRVKQINMTDQDKLRSIYSTSQRPGGLSGMQGSVSKFMNSSMEQTFGNTTAIQRAGQRGLGFFGGMSAAAYGALGMETGVGTRAEALTQSGASTTTNLDVEGVLVSNVGAGAKIRTEEVQRTSEAIRRRAGAPTEDSMFGGQGVSADIATVRSAYRSMMSNTGNIAKLKAMKESMSPAAYADALSSMLREQGGPGVVKALDSLHKSNSQKGASGKSSDLDAISVVQGEDRWKANFLQADFGEIASDTGVGMQKLLQDGKAFSGEVDSRVEKALALVGGLSAMPGGEMLARLAGSNAKGILGAVGLYRDTGFSKEQLSTFLTEGGAAADELAQFISEGGSDYSKYSALYEEAQKNKKLQTFLGSIGQMSGTQRHSLADQVGLKGGVRALMAAKATAGQISEHGEIASQELAKLGGGGSSELRGILGQFAKAGASANVGLFEETRKRTINYAQSLSPEEVASLRKGGGAIAEHIADLADISRLDLTKRGQGGVSDLPKGLRDNWQIAQGVLPPEEFEKLNTILKKPVRSKEESETIRTALQKLEESLVASGTRKSADVQKDMLTEMSKFAGASKDFVIAVSAAVPALGDLKASQVAEAAKRISENSATGGGTSGRVP